MINLEDNFRPTGVLAVLLAALDAKAAFETFAANLLSASRRIDFSSNRDLEIPMNWEQVFGVAEHVSRPAKQVFPMPEAKAQPTPTANDNQEIREDLAA